MAAGAVEAVAFITDIPHFEHISVDRAEDVGHIAPLDRKVGIYEHDSGAYIVKNKLFFGIQAYQFVFSVLTFLDIYSNPVQPFLSCIAVFYRFYRGMRLPPFILSDPLKIYP